MRKTVFTIICFILIGKAHSQIPVGQWREHLPYSQVKLLTASDKLLYCSTQLGLFTYNKTEGTLERINTITGLSDVEITALEFNRHNNTLILGYSNGNIDLIKNRVIQNVSDIKRKQIVGNKAINNIFLINNIAYLSCGFGIVLLDTDNGNISDTYLIGENAGFLNINEITYNSDLNEIFVATDKGIYSADFNNPNLIDFQNWTHHSAIPNSSQKFSSIVNYQGKIYTSYDSTKYKSDTIYVYNGISWNNFDNSLTDVKKLIAHDDYLMVVKTYAIDLKSASGELIRQINNFGFDSPRPNHIIIENSTAWIADARYGLVKGNNFKQYDYFYPNGPSNNTSFNMASTDDNLWAVMGGKKVTGVNLYNNATCYSFINNTWNTLNNTNVPEIENLLDYVAVAINPLNPKQVFVASWGYGITEFLNGQYVYTYNDTNTNGALQNVAGLLQSAYVRIGGMNFDNNGNLWITNASVSRAISVMKQNGEWQKLNYTINGFPKISDIIITKNGNKWVLVPGTGVFVFNEYQTYEDQSDDDDILFKVIDVDGNVISNEVYSIAEDHDGVIWVGTNDGVVAYYNPQNVFSGEYFYAQQIIIELEKGNAQYLLGNESVNAIVIDGANRKWFGTNNGVFLMSENVDQQIYAFNTGNSPLISDKISSMAINSKSGEVFFGTEKGIVSFRSDANEGERFMSKVYVFPNPVTHDYDGSITITGLIKETNVKITDIAGNLVWETESNGGMAIWDGKNFAGQKPYTGVYLVFCSNADGSQTAITKFLIVN